MVATVNIPGLPVGLAITGAEIIPAVQNGVDRRFTFGQLALFSQSSAAAALRFQAPLQLNAGIVSLGGFTAQADNGVMYRASSAAVGVTAAGTIGALLMGGGPSAGPSFSVAGSTGQMLLGNTTAAVSWLSAAATTGQLLASTAAAAPVWIPAGVSGQVLIGNTGANPSWSSSIPGSAGVTSFAGGATGLTPAGATVGAILLGGVLNVAFGGTGVTASTGTGATVRNISPTLVTPSLLTATLVTPIITGALTYGGVTLSAAVTGTGPMVLGVQPSITSAALATPTITGALTYGGVTLSAAVTGTGPMVAGISPTLSSPIVGTQPLGTNNTLAASTGFVSAAINAIGRASGVGTTFLTNDAAIANGSLSNILTAAAIGGANQLWYIGAKLVPAASGGQAAVAVGIHNGSSFIDGAEGVTPGATQDITLSLGAVVLLTAATSFVLQAQSNAASTLAKCSAALAIPGLASKMTSITCVRLA